MSDDKKPQAEQLSIDARLAKLQQRRMGAPEEVPKSPSIETTSEPMQTEKKLALPTEQTTKPTMPNLPRIGQPLTHDRRSRVPFGERYYKDNIMVDKRLLPYYVDFMSKCRSKVEGANAMLLDFLISRGYDIDPHLLDKPFEWKDLSQQEE